MADGAQIAVDESALSASGDEPDGFGSSSLRAGESERRPLIPAGPSSLTGSPLAALA